MTTRLLISLLITLPILALLPSGVVGHARLAAPAPWNASPSKTQNCGVGAQQAIPASFKVTAVDPSQLLTVQWVVVVGDGVGALSASIDPTAKSNPGLTDFSVRLTSVGANNPNAVSATPYRINFQIPANTVCTGPGGTCTLRVISTSGWVACSTISIAGAATTRPPTTRAPTTTPPVVVTTTNAPRSTDAPIATTAPVDTSEPTIDPNDLTIPSLADMFVPYPAVSNPCVVATGLVTCSSVNGQSVQLMGPSLAILDADVQEQVNFALTNTSVLTTPNVAGCAQAFTDLICAQSFPPCSMNMPVICTSACQRVNNLCSPNATKYSDGSSHASLYNCANTQLGFTATVSDTTGNCPNVDTGVRPSSSTDSPTQSTTTTSTRAPTRTPVRNHALAMHSSITIVSLTIVLAMIAHRTL